RRLAIRARTAGQLERLAEGGTASGCVDSCCDEQRTAALEAPKAIGEDAALLDEAVVVCDRFTILFEPTLLASRIQLGYECSLECFRQVYARLARGGSEVGPDAHVRGVFLRGFG